MKIQVLQEELSKALNTTSRFASNKVQLPVLANVLLNGEKNKLLIAATNLETSVSVKIGAKVEKEGAITVPARTITDIVSNLKPGQVNIEVEKESISLASSGFRSSVSGMNPMDFPSVPNETGAGSIGLSLKDFQDALSLVLFAVSIDETRPVLTGTLMIIKGEEAVLVATDGFRLSQKKLKVGKGHEEKRLIIPKNVLSELIRIGSGEKVEFSYKKSENQVIFGVNNIVLSSRVIEGEFPDFERIIPKEGKIRIVLDKEEFLRSVKVASVFARDAANVVKLAVSSDSLEILSESQQTGSQKTGLDAKIEGNLSKDTFTIAFNFRFLEDFLGAVKSGEIHMEFSEPNAPAVFLDPKDTNFLHIIMPVRL